MMNSQFAIAVHVLMMLAKKSDEYVKSDFLAESVNTNAVVIRRLLCGLREAGLVISQTGSAGGTRLSRKAEEINLADVFQAVSSGFVFALHPKPPNQDCPVGKNIESILCNLQKDIDQAIGEKLEKYTLRDVLERVEFV